MKHFGLFSFVLVATLFIATSQGVNTTFGAIWPYDTLLHREYVVLKPQFFRVVSRDVVFPPRGYYNQKTISGVRAIDRSRGQKGGYATLYRGGPGFRNVTLYLQSQRSQALNFTVEIFGR